MAINKVPNNYYNDTNIRRDKINTIIDHVNELDTHAVVPTPAAGDVGKIIKVGENGSYELGEDAGSVFPEITDSDNYKLIQVRNSNYSLTYDSMLARSFVTTDSAKNITSSQYITLRAVEGSTGSISFTFLASSMTINAIATTVNNGGAILHFTNKEGIKFIGFAYANSSTSITAIVHRIPDGQLFTLELESSNYTLTPIGSLKYLSVTVTGGLNAISLPDSMTYDDLKALLDVSTVYIVDDDTSDIYSIERYDGSSAIFRHIGISSAYVTVESIEFNNLGGTYSEVRVNIHT